MKRLSIPVRAWVVPHPGGRAEVMVSINGEASSVAMIENRGGTWLIASTDDPNAPQVPGPREVKA